MPAKFTQMMGVLFLLLGFQVLGTPTREQIREMNPNYTEFKFPQIKAHPWTKVCSRCTSQALATRCCPQIKSCSVFRLQALT